MIILEKKNDAYLSICGLPLANEAEILNEANKAIMNFYFKSNRT